MYTPMRNLKSINALPGAKKIDMLSKLLFLHECKDPKKLLKLLVD